MQRRNLHQNGFLIPVGDKKLFAEKLQQLMDDENMRSSFIENAKETITAFHPEKLAQTYLDFIAAK